MGRGLYKCTSKLILTHIVFLRYLSPVPSVNVSPDPGLGEFLADAGDRSERGREGAEYLRDELAFREDWELRPGRRRRRPSLPGQKPRPGPGHRPRCAKRCRVLRHGAYGLPRETAVGDGRIRVEATCCGFHEEF